MLTATEIRHGPGRSPEAGASEWLRKLVRESALLNAVRSALSGENEPATESEGAASAFPSSR